MTDFSSRILEEMAAKFGEAPAAFTMGDGIDWSSPLGATNLYVELPFWLMMQSGSIEIRWSGVAFSVEICPPWMELFGREVTDSRATVLRHGPRRPKKYDPPGELAEKFAREQIPSMQRGCKTVLRLSTRSHASAFRDLGEKDPPRAKFELEAYWASLCEAHVPVVNELIQRYRLLTYDYHAFEVSAWDVPVWYLSRAGVGCRAVLLPYKAWDVKPASVEGGESEGDPPKIQPFEWTTPVKLAAASSEDATPGEFDLLDARSLMERGDYTGAVRRTVTAIEAILGWALLAELEKHYEGAEAAVRLKTTDNNFPARLKMWRGLARPAIDQVLFDELESTRQIRHEIVHRGRRLIHSDRGRAQRSVDTGRWLYNKIEARPDRAKLRDSGTLKSVGRVALALRFPANLASDGITLGPLEPPVTSPTPPRPSSASPEGPPFRAP